MISRPYSVDGQHMLLSELLNLAIGSKSQWPKRKQHKQHQLDPPAFLPKDADSQSRIHRILLYRAHRSLGKVVMGRNRVCDHVSARNPCMSRMPPEDLIGSMALVSPAMAAPILFGKMGQRFAQCGARLCPGTWMKSTSRQPRTHAVHFTPSWMISRLLALHLPTGERVEPAEGFYRHCDNERGTGNAA